MGKWFDKLVDKATRELEEIEDRRLIQQEKDRLSHERDNAHAPQPE